MSLLFLWFTFPCCVFVSLLEFLFCVCDVCDLMVRFLILFCKYRYIFFHQFVLGFVFMCEGTLRLPIWYFAPFKCSLCSRILMCCSLLYRYLISCLLRYFTGWCVFLRSIEIFPFVCWFKFFGCSPLILHFLL